MKSSNVVRLCGLLGALCFTAAAPGADPALTIYNQNFAVIREILPVDLKAGNNTLSFVGVTAHVEPDSVILRDPTGRRTLQVLEQNYRNDPINHQRLLNLFEGKTIEFQTRDQDGSIRAVMGRIVRSGFLPRVEPRYQYGQEYIASQMGAAQGGAGEPIIEVGGKFQFSLPGQPIFPTLGDETALKPALDWTLYSAQPARFDAELSYVSGGMSWSADYNLVAPEEGDTLDLVGWVTLNNQSGRQFDHARVKLMAGDVNKAQSLSSNSTPYGIPVARTGGAPAQVEEKIFEDYHLYTLPRPTTLRDRETKQVEFLRAAGVQSKRLYIYDGMRPERGYNGYDIRQNQQYGAQSNPHVWVMREFVNSDVNRLGKPLPKGRVRFYRRDQDGQLEFVGENQIDHTAKDEVVRVYTGNAFDITGERKQTKFQSQSVSPSGFVDESFEIKLRNHKNAPATVRVIEHLYRWSNWVITQESAPHRQTDSRTLEFEVRLQPDEERALTYTVHYSW